MAGAHCFASSLFLFSRASCLEYVVSLTQRLCCSGSMFHGPRYAVPPVAGEGDQRTLWVRYWLLSVVACILYSCSFDRRTWIPFASPRTPLSTLFNPSPASYCSSPLC